MTTIIAKTLLKSCFINSIRPTKINLRLSSTYRAAVLREIGKPLIIEEIKQEKLKKNEVRIKIEYCSANSVDVLNFRESSNLPFVPGYELSGEVLEVGKNVTAEHITVGEKVAALSLQKFGGFAEECIVEMNDTWRVPSNIELKDAAVILCGHSTAIYTFGKLCIPKKDDTIIISCGSGGLGLAAVEVAASMYKAKVIAVTNTELSSDLVRSRGAFQTVHFDKSIKKDILKLTSQKGADIVYDAVGDYMLEEVASCVSSEGRIFHAAPVIYKTIAPPPPNSSLTIVSLHMLREQNPEVYRSMVADTLELADEGILSAHISAKYSLEDVNEAIQYIESNACTGKVLLTLDD